MKLIKRLFTKNNKIKPMQSNGRPRIDLSINKIIELKEQGVSVNKIAKILGVSEKTIRNRLKEIKTSDKI